MATCGGCGAQFEPEDDDDWNTICGSCPIPHMLITRQAPGRDHFRCDYCGEEGTQGALAASECPYDHDDCEHCGGAPYCEKDCPGIAEILNRPDVYVAGFPTKES